MVLLSLVLPTVYQAVVNVQVGPGSTLVNVGAGPVGLMAAASARMLGAHRIFAIDHHGFQLQCAAETYWVEPINHDKVDDLPQHIIGQLRFRGVDASIEAMGFKAEGSAVETLLATIKLRGSSGGVLLPAIAATCRDGIGTVPGLFAGLFAGLQAGLHAALHAAFIRGCLFDDAFDKGVQFRMGQTHVQHHMPKLLEHIGNGKLKPEVIVSPSDKARRRFARLRNV